MREAIAGLGLIGDRRTCAAIESDGTVCWYSPKQLDRPSIFTALLGQDASAWRIALAGARPAGRRYLGDSAILETRLAAQGDELCVTDWMNLSRDARPGVLCRQLSAAPADTVISFAASKDYGRCRWYPALAGGAAVYEDGSHLFASHPLRLDGAEVRWHLPAGETGWTVLADAPCDPPQPDAIERWRGATMARWQELAATTTYHGPYAAEVAASLRQLRLLVFEPTGAIAASATLGLPEVLGGTRNYDYRYAWLRDSGMILRALLRTAERSTEGDAFLRFIALARNHSRRKPLDMLTTVDGRPVPSESTAPVEGYEGSRPVRIGNRAATQLQLGALGNFLLAAAMVYRERDMRDCWDSVAAVADFLAMHWRRPDSGMWESPTQRQYTVSKALAACGLRAIAAFADQDRRDRYERAADEIRRYVYRHCRTREGAFAAFVGCAGVDVSAVLFPLWSFCPVDAPEMDATLQVLERNYERDGLFAREDETQQAALEGAFLPGTFWIAQYWTARGDFDRACRYIEAGLKCSNDLGVMPEEIDWQTGAALGNVPLGMAHASFLNAIADLGPHLSAKE